MDFKMTVDEPIRKIVLELDAKTADAMAKWLVDASNALGNTSDRPHGMGQLFGALRAIADNRGYGGH